MKITSKIAKNITLVDDKTEHGGISHLGETLYEFMKESGLPFGCSLAKVNEALKECGIEPVETEMTLRASTRLEYKDMELLNKVARHSKMDCWFCIDDCGRVKDCESGKYINALLGVSQLIDGMSEYDMSQLTRAELERLVLMIPKLV